MVWKIDPESVEKQLKKLKKLDSEIQQRIRSKLDDCAEDPYQYATPLTNLPYYRVRVGDYRIILDIDEPESTITVVKIDHRSKVYGR